MFLERFLAVFGRQMDDYRYWYLDKPLSYSFFTTFSKEKRSHSFISKPPKAIACKFTL
ncbi:hypothetical protein LC609_29525 [Nostoc sp. XA013]|nr:hypothetical protein [Nostoc sp. XA013]